MQVTVVDYGMGNLGSIANMLRHLGHTVLVTSNAEDIIEAKKLILPGVGSFDRGMERLTENGLVDALHESVLEKKTPVLGICLGLHLMAKSSDEGSRSGLGWFDTGVVKFNPLKAKYVIRVPHMGWNTVTPGEACVFPAAAESRFYFVHSYHLDNLPATQILFRTEHGYEFISGACRDNIYGVQFHPEKSHRFGMSLLSHFVDKV